MLKKGTPVQVPAPIIEGVVKAMKTVDDDHVEYLVGYMSGSEYVERWFTDVQLSVPTDLAKGVALAAAGVERSFNMQEDESKRSARGLEFFDKATKALAEIYSLDPVDASSALGAKVDTTVMKQVNQQRDTVEEEAQARAEAAEAK